MYFYNKKSLKPHRKELRNNSTYEEIILWQYLKGGKLGFKFRRQQSIGPYIVDFCCVLERIIIELDGEYHIDNKAYDEVRTEFLEQAGFIVLRFWNNEVRENINRVILIISNKLHPTPNPSL